MRNPAHQFTLSNPVPPVIPVEILLLPTVGSALAEQKRCPTEVGPAGRVVQLQSKRPDQAFARSGLHSELAFLLLVAQPTGNTIVALPRRMVTVKALAFFVAARSCSMFWMR